jgi:EpsD family peptidyl-prolyl cis-trans isomerase
VDKVIDRELLVQQALRAHLERDPQVAAEIDNARRDVLAQAYIDHAAGGLTRPTREEVMAFYAENPALFAERRIYRTRALEVSGNPEMVALLRSQAAARRDLDELAAWLKARDARFSLGARTQAAEEMPLAFLPRLAAMKPGELAVFATPDGARVVELVESRPAPLALEQAMPVIENFLAARKRLEVAAAEVKRLRAAASIEYVAQFKQSTR